VPGGEAAPAQGPGPAEGAPSAGPGLPGSGAAGKGGPAPPLGRLLGNRDFLVTVDCYGDHVTVFPGGSQFRWKANAPQATDAAIAQHVRELIDRRQAGVQPGEPPYRPAVRFQVAGDGLRTYYHVYPLLEPLRVPMMRENLED
jgi:hypothetical protein